MNCCVCNGPAGDEGTCVICEKCDEAYCEDCAAPFTSTSCIDYNCCSICADLDYAFQPRKTNKKASIYATQTGRVCDHKWVEYKGLFENYRFCEKCDVKEVK